MNSFRFAAGVSAAALLLASAAQAQTDPSGADETRDVDEIVVTGSLSRYSATKSDTPVAETPRSISLETRADLIDKGALNLADAYVYSAGVFGDTYGFATRGDWVKIRGLDAPEYRDSLQALFGSYNNTRPDIYTLQQVEILKGPAAVLYGQGSPGGLVNVVSKLPQAEPFHEVVAEIGSFDRQQIAADFTGALDGDETLLYRLIGVHRDSGTQIDFVNDDTLVIAPSLTWRPTPGTTITLLGNYQENEGAAGAQFLPVQGTLLPAPNGRFIDNDVFLGEPGFDRYDTRSHSLTLLAEHRLNEIFTLEATARYTSGEADYNQAWPAFIGGSRYVFNDDGSLYGGGLVPRTFYVSDAQSEQLAADFRARADFDTGVLRHDILAGLQYQDVTTDNDTAYAFALGYDFATGGPGPVYGDRFWINVFDPEYTGAPSDEILNQFYSDSPESNTRDLGIYIQDRIEYSDWLVTLGGRWDAVETDTGPVTQEDDAFSVSGGLMYRFASGLNPYVSYSESFEPIIGLDANDETYDPQEGVQYEAGIKYQPPGSSSLITASVFTIEQSNLLTPDPGNPAFSIQTGEVNIDGVELEAQTRVQDFFVELNASHLETETSDGFRLPSVPENQASAWVTWRPEGRLLGFKTGGGVRYVGESWDGADSLATPDYTLVDAMIGYETETWDFTVNARNLLDEDYQATCLARGDCFPGEERSVVARAAYRF